MRNVKNNEATIYNLLHNKPPFMNLSLGTPYRITLSGTKTKLTPGGVLCTLKGT